MNYLERWRRHAAKAYAYGTEEKPGTYTADEVDVLIDFILVKPSFTSDETHELTREELS